MSCLVDTTLAIAIAAGVAADGCSSKVSSTAPPCAAPLTACGVENTCVDPQTDALNCGACGNACAMGQACQAAQCVTQCGGGTSQCGSACVDVRFDPQNCGGCAMACAKGLYCSAGKCGFDCSGGSARCGDKCADTMNDPQNCGGCGMSCGAGLSCQAGQCAADCPGASKCGGKCVDVMNDPQNCGGCAMACDGGKVCQAGMCVVDCLGGTTRCGSACADTMNDPKNCGACGTNCGSGLPCQAGVCADGVVKSGAGRRWADGSYAAACYGYRQGDATHVYAGATGDGRYTIQPDPNQAAFDVYCEMTTAGGGWTLVDNDADTMSAFHTRDPGANPDITVTRGSYLPAYTWSATPQLLCKSSVFSGAQPWLVLDAAGAVALEYPTKTSTTDGYASTQGDWTVGGLNGNTFQGLGSWIYVGSGRFGSVWIGNGGQPTCACDYYAPSSETGLGMFQSGDGPTCSTWVR